MATTEKSGHEGKEAESGDFHSLFFNKLGTFRTSFWGVFYATLFAWHWKALFYFVGASTYVSPRPDPS